MPPSKKLCNKCATAGLTDCEHCLCEACAWCSEIVARPGSDGVCGGKREKGGSRFCRSCRRNRSRERNLERDALIAGAGPAALAGAVEHESLAPERVDRATRQRRRRGRG